MSLNLSPYNHKWSEEFAVDYVKSLLPRQFFLKCVELARHYYKLSGYHNFTHALQAATYLISHPNKSGISGWFAMLMHDAHWSKTDDRHNVIASIYRAIKLNHDHDLGLDNEVIAQCIAATTFYEGRFICPNMYFEEVHTADLLGGIMYDTWTSQFNGLCDELGRPMDLAALSDNHKFLSNTRADPYMLKIYLSHLADVICESVTLEVMKKRYAMLGNNVQPNCVVLSEFLIKILTDKLTTHLCRPTKSAFYGLDILVGQEDKVKVGYYE